MPQRKKDAMDIDRQTVRRYREWAAEHGLLEGELPALPELQACLVATLPAALPPQNVSTVAPYRLIVDPLHPQIDIHLLRQEDL